MKVSQNVINAYLGMGKTKYIDLYFPELDLSILGGTGRMYSDSMHLSEKLVNSSSIEFVGCISSMFKIQVNNLKEDVKGKKITVTIHTEGTESEPITLFNGVVDSAMKQSNKRIKEIVAYDELYTKGNTDVSAWYKSLAFPVTLKVLRDSLFAHIGIEQMDTPLPNDSVQIKKQYNPSSLQALSVIKAICQINGVFGIINRKNKFEYRILGAIKTGLYTPFYPSENTFPGVSKSALRLDGVNLTDFPYYKSVDYEEYVVKPVDKITIRQSEGDEGVTYGSGSNNYIIQGNMFAYGLSKEVLLQVVENIYPNIQGFSYHPFQSINNGLPYLECGIDAASYMMIDWEATEKAKKEAAKNRSANEYDIIYEQKDFYILNRELSGIQGLKDSYSAQGEEYQTEFITDLQTQIDLLKKKNSQETQEIQQQIEDYTYSREEIDQKFDSGGSKWDVVSVPVLPTTIAANTMYLIQGEVVVEVMGRQSARLYFQGKDHKDIYFNGHYHDQMYLSDGERNVTLVWEKIKEGIFKFLIMPIDTFEFWVQGSMHIDWGDGESSDFEGVGTIKKCRHSYTKSAKFMVLIRGDIQNISFGLGTAENDLIEILTKFPKTMEKATGMAGLFSVNKNLERIPAGLFDNCPNVESFHNTFLGCVSLKNIPAGLFDNCPNVKNFRDTFGSCSSLERIPAGLFDSCPNAESFQSTFNGCSNIKEIPKGLFKNCPEAVQFQQTFSRCSGLTSIPSDIFADSINMSIFSETFYDCFNLTYIPSGLFDGRPNVESFKRTFAYCRNVVSNVPELWKTHGSTKEHAACFNGCDKAENFKDIPASWYYE